jgi:hypothetical protein
MQKSYRLLIVVSLLLGSLVLLLLPVGVGYANVSVQTPEPTDTPETPTPTPTLLPDLTVEILDVAENCASADQCTVLVDLVVRNQGQGHAGPFYVFVSAFIPPPSLNGVGVNGLGAGEEQSFKALPLFPSGPSCYAKVGIPACAVSAEVDSGEEIAESDGANNGDSSTDSSP